MKYLGKGSRLLLRCFSSSMKSSEEILWIKKWNIREYKWSTQCFSYETEPSAFLCYTIKIKK